MSIAIFKLYYYISMDVWRFLLGCKAHHIPSISLYFFKVTEYMHWDIVTITIERID